MNSDPPGDALWRGDPALESFLGTLTSGPTAGELAGQEAVLAAFRDARAARDARVAGAALGAAESPFRPARRARWRGRLVLAGLATAALAIGIASAGYEGVLPPSLQHVANGVIRTFGLREGGQPAQPPAGSQTSPQAVGTLNAGGGQASAVPGSKVPPPARGTNGRIAMPLRTGLIAWASSGPRSPAGASVTITALLTDNAKGVRDASLRLREHTAGKPGWRLVTMARTRANGIATLAAGRLAVSAWFRVTGPGPHASVQFAVIVIPRVRLRQKVGPGGRPDVLSVRCRYAARRDVVLLQVWSSVGQWSGTGPQARAWRTVRRGRVRKTGYASFAVSADAAGQVYRVVLEATGAHGRATSNLVLVEPGFVSLTP